MIKELTGKHVLAIAVVAFGIILTANMAMLFAATGSFPGLVVKNSYVAGVNWNERTGRQQALGWRPEITYDGGQLAVRLDGARPETLADLRLTVTVGRPTDAREDRVLSLTAVDGVFAAPIDLGPGRWRIALATEDGPAFRTTAQLTVPRRR